MTTLAIAFGLAWTAVAAFAGWMGLQHRRLSRRIDAVESAEYETHAELPARRAA